MIATAPREITLLPRLRAALADLDPAQGCAVWLDTLVRQHLDRLPLPAAGATLQRWQALSAVAEHDLSLAKLYEGHTDALAIMAELAPGFVPPAGSTWGVWAAEAPAGRCRLDSTLGARALLNGAKCWCSGAAHVSHGLLTGWYADGSGPQLVRVAMQHAGVSVSSAAWQAVGMAGSASLDIDFTEVPAEHVGAVGAYLSRPGFRHGGAGIAACWYGGALALAGSLRRALLDSAVSSRGAFRLAALGKVDVALQGTAAVLRESAAWIDAHPGEDAAAVAHRARLSAEATAQRVLDEAGRALGAAAFCRDARFARAAADLPVFVRQSHGERDLAALGEMLLAADCRPWPL